MAIEVGSYRVVKDLQKILGPDKVDDDELIVRLYSKDAVYFESSAIAVVFPTSTEEVSEVVKYAYKNDIKIYPQGSASEIVGSSTPSEDGIVISFDRMNKIKEINIVDSYAIVEAGTRMLDLNAMLAAEGYMFPVDPASVKAVTIGGAICSGAGGMMGAKYGTMKDWVNGLTVVLPDEDGTILRLGGKTTKNREGYDLTRLIVGSEGTLAIVTEAILRITTQPKSLATVVGFFPTLEDLLNAVVDIKRSKITPFIMEFVDAKTVDITIKVVGSKVKGEGNYLVVSVDTTPEATDRVLSKLEEIMRRNYVTTVYKARTMDEAEMKGFFDIRRNYYPASIRLAAEGLKDPNYRLYVYVEDISVPPSKAVDAVKRLRELEKEYGIPMTLAGHIGDGNLHPVLWFYEYETEKREKFDDLVMDIMKVAIDLGGVMSSEHGIGTTKKEGLVKQFEAKNSLKALEIMREIKKIFDPKGLLNPGKVL